MIKRLYTDPRVNKMLMMMNLVTCPKKMSVTCLYQLMSVMMQSYIAC